MKSKDIISILTFFVIASALTYAFNHLPAIPVNALDLKSSLFYNVDLKDIICGFGPLISGLICYKIFKTKTDYSIGGRQPLKPWLTVLVCIITFLFTNKTHSIAANLLIISTQLIYCFGEEFGWRHFLQSDTNGLNKWIQPLLIGFLWFCWHYSWLDNPVKSMLGDSISKAPVPVAIAMTILFLALFSALLGWLINRTKSILFPTLFHLVLKVNSTTLLVVVAVTLIFIFTWNKTGKRNLKLAGDS